MNLSRSLAILLLFSFFLSLASAVQAASIKERMAARLPEINTLKDKGIIGENNVGLLEYRSADKPSAKLIADENKDRAATYAAIGKKQNLSTTKIGQLRAKMIADNGRSGHWYQKPGGEWYRK